MYRRCRNYRGIGKTDGVEIIMALKDKFKKIIDSPKLLAHPSGRAFLIAANDRLLLYHAFLHILFL